MTNTVLPKHAPKLPGYHSPSNHYLRRVIRVNQAGEYGAKRIYQGQKDALKHSPILPEIEHMAKQEEKHLEYFNHQIYTRRIRPSALFPLWHIGGYALGWISGKMGEKSAMACTVAVEEVIDNHYQHQLEVLPEEESDLKKNIELFRQEELEHRDTGLEHHAEKAAGYAFFMHAIKSLSRAAIFTAKRV